MTVREFDIGDALGAETVEANRRISLYFPNKDCDGNIIKNIDIYVRAAMRILSDINGGATKLPIADGWWKNPETNLVVEESTVVIYSNIYNIDSFVDNFDSLKKLLHNFGRATKQGAVMVEFFGDGLKEGDLQYKTYNITSYT